MINAIYASTGGNGQFVIEYIAKKSSKELCLIRSESFTPDSISDEMIFVTSTWEHGVLNPYMDKALEYIEGNDMTSKSAYFIGLGDHRYEPVLFCEGINIVERAFITAGGAKKGETLKIDNDPYAQTDILDTWIRENLDV